VLAKAGSITPHTRFLGEVSLLKEEDGGRHTPLFTNDRPQFYFRTKRSYGTVNLPEGVKMVIAGDTITMTIEIIAPVAIEEQTRFAIPRRRQDARRWRRDQDPDSRSGRLSSPQVDLVQQAAPVQEALVRPEPGICPPGARLHHGISTALRRKSSARPQRISTRPFAASGDAGVAVLLRFVAERLTNPGLMHRTAEAIGPWAAQRATQAVPNT